MDLKTQTQTHKLDRAALWTAARANGPPHKLCVECTDSGVFFRSKLDVYFTAPTGGRLPMAVRRAYLTAIEQQMRWSPTEYWPVVDVCVVSNPQAWVGALLWGADPSISKGTRFFNRTPADPHGAYGANADADRRIVANTG